MRPSTVLRESYALSLDLRLGVERALEVGSVILEEALAAADLVIGIVLHIVSSRVLASAGSIAAKPDLINTPGSVDGNVDVAEEGGVGEVDGADNVSADGLLLVVLAPVDIRATSLERLGECTSR